VLANYVFVAVSRELSTSQKAGLTGLYKKVFVLSTTAISKLVFQEVDGTVILPLTFIKE
jgi:hypothetical protein